MPLRTEMRSVHRSALHRGNVCAISLGLAIGGCSDIASPPIQTSSSSATPSAFIGSDGVFSAAGQNPPNELRTNSIGMQFAIIPRGSVKIGSPTTDAEALPDEMPQHRIEIASAFEMGIHEVTVGQYRQFTKSTKYRTLAERMNVGFAFNSATKRLEPKTGSSWKSVGFPQTEDHPVINIAFEDATAFCDWLTAKEHLNYKLPTELEWEYACRAGTETKWHCGDDVASLRKHSNLCDSSLKRAYPFATWCVEWNDGFDFTAPVGSFSPNGFGLYDMHGNVFEWCSDFWPESGYAGQDISDPKEPRQKGSRIVRGGSFLSLTRFTRSADRVGLNPSLRNCIVGFRVVRSSSDSDDLKRTEKQAASESSP